MKILQVPATFLPRTGGIPYYVYYMNKEFMKQGDDASVLTSTVGSSKLSEIFDGISVTRVNSIPIFGMPLSVKLFFEILKSDADIVQLHYPHPLFLDIAVLGCILSKKKYVVYSHGKEIRMNWLFGIPSYLYNKICYNFVLKHASVILVNSRRAVASSCLLSKYKKKTKVVYHGVDTEKFVGKVRSLHSPLRVLFVGALRRYKGLDYLIDAAKLLEKRSVQFTIVGNGPEEVKIKQKVKSLGLEKNILFKDFLSEKELLREYASCDIFVLPSPSLEESFGMVALEAGAMGKPVIVTRGAGVSELFLKEKIGIIVKPYSSDDLAKTISSLITKPEQVKSIGKKLKKVLILKYSWKSVALQTLTVYRAILK